MPPLNASQIALVERVLQHFDSLDAPGANISASNDSVYEHLKTAARYVILDAPRKLLFSLQADQRAKANAAINADVASAPETLSGYLRIPLPSDHLRLIALDLQTWTQPVYEIRSQEEAGHDYDRWLKGAYNPPASKPEVFHAPYENYEGVSWAGKEALWAVPGDVTNTVVTANGAFSVGATTINVDALTSPIGAGVTLTFSGGGVFVTSAEASAGATALTGVLSVATVADDETAEHFDGVSRFLYVPETAPETLDTNSKALTAPMTWLAASLVSVGIDPFVSRLCQDRYDLLMGKERQVRRLGVKRRYRGLG